MAGAVVTSLAFLASSFAPTINVLIFTYGVLGGLGVSMIYLPSILIVGFYFEKRRALANGIASSGSGIGAFVFSPLLEALITSYTWRGAILIVSGILLNCLVCGAVFRPIRPLKNLSKPKKNEIKLNSDDKLKNENGVQWLLEQSNDNLFDTKLPLPDIIISIREGENNQMYDVNSNCCTESVHCMHDSLSAVHSSVSSTCLPSEEVKLGVSLAKDVLRQYSDCTKAESQQMLKDNISSSLDNELDDTNGATLLYKRAREEERQREREAMQNPLYRKDIFYSGSITNLPEYNNFPDSKHYIRSMLSIPSLTDYGDETCMEKCKRNIKGAFQQPLLMDPLFILNVIPCMLWTCQSTIIIYLPDFALTENLSKDQAAQLISVIGIANTVGRIFIGWLVDRPCIDCLLLNACAMVVAGVATIIIPFVPVFPVLVGYCCIFGLSMSTWVSLRPLVLVEILGIDQLTSAFGLLAMFQGIAFSTGPPLAGMMYDATNSYVVPLVTAGAMFIFAGCAAALLRPMLKWRKRKSMTSISLDSSVFHEIVERSSVIIEDSVSEKLLVFERETTV